jgi:hypothetical protein
MIDISFNKKLILLSACQLEIKFEDIRIVEQAMRQFFVFLFRAL